MTRPLRSLIVGLNLLLIGGATASAQHAGHEPQNESSQQRPPTVELPAFILPVTEEDRKAAFPDVGGHATHGSRVNYFVLFDQLEWQSSAGGTGVNVDAKGWVGGDRTRLWFRTQGDGEDGRVGDAEVHILYGRQLSRWWDVVGGVRQDFAPGPARTWAAVGVQGLAPYWFEIELTAYVGEEGRTHVRGEVEYELLITNRLVLQPQFEIGLSGKSDPERGIGAGINETHIGFRLRYEFKRELAPYVGVLWNSKWGETAEFAEAAGEGASGARFVAGVRLWF
jgi:copper resistance protein B